MKLYLIVWRVSGHSLLENRERKAKGPHSPQKMSDFDRMYDFVGDAGTLMKKLGADAKSIVD